MSRSSPSLDAITLSIVWARLLSIVDEAGSALQRTAFSTVTRESNDFAVVLMDAEGRSIAQSSISVPSFLGVIPMLTKALLAGPYPAASWRPGDVVMTNDPWLCAGHKPDIGLVSPVFFDDQLVAFLGTIAHSPDMGGTLWGAGARDLYEEGLMVPPTKLFSEGKPNDTLFAILEANVRSPRQTIGDIRAQLAANDQGTRALRDLMVESSLRDIKGLSQQVRDASERAMRDALRAAPDGTWRYRYQADGDGRGDGVDIALALTIAGDVIDVDYTGTRGVHALGINAVANYTYAYTAYPIKCVFSPDVPNNDGGFLPIRVSAPVGSMLNAQAPAPLGARNITGNILHAAVFGALAQAVPDRVQADCGSACWSVVLNGRLPDRGEFVEYFFLNGGYGARAAKDGPSVLSFPTNVANVPIEVLEHAMPMLVHEKSLRPDSGGDGEFRGGLGQRVSFEWRGNEPVNCSLLSEKTVTRAHGLCGGGPGAPGAIQITPERPLAPKGLTRLASGDRLTLDLPGGGGYGDATRRDAAARAHDLQEGYVTSGGTPS
jgi:N-methylhydantoinase B